MVKNKRSYNKLRLIFSVIWPVVPVSLMIGAILANIATSESWRYTFLYSGDSLTLAIITQAIQRGESLHVILSSQLFFFPEGLLYAVSYLLGGSFYTSFLVNSVIIFFLLYLLFLSITKHFFTTLFTRQLAALVPVGLITLYATLETQAWVNQSAIATLLFLTTYYYGVILASLFLIFTTLSLFDLLPKFSQHKRKIWILTTLSFIAVAATGASNPLLFIQFCFPYLIVLGVLYLINRLPGKFVLWLAGIQLIGIVVALGIRHLFSGMIGSDTQSYLNFNKVPEAVKALGATGKLILQHSESMLEFGIIFLLITSALAYIFIVIYRLNRKHTYSVKELFLIFFAGSSPFVVFAAVLITGNSPTRYYQPLLIFPLLGLIVFLARLHTKNVQKYTLISVTTVLCVFFAIFIIVKIPRAQPLTHAIPSDLITCFQDYAKDKPTLNTVSGFWTARALDLYEDNPSVRVLQVDINLRKMGWMNNLTPYDGKEFDTIISRHGNTDVMNIFQLEEPPAETTECPDYSIYRYNVGSKAYKLLNEQIQRPAVH